MAIMITGGVQLQARLLWRLIKSDVGDGANRWAAAPLKDVAHLYRLAVEQTGPGVVYHAVQEEGVALREIAETLGKGLKVPVVSIDPEKAAEHFGWFAHFAGVDMPASSEWTRKALGWKPTGPGLIEDLTNTKFSDQAAHSGSRRP